MKKGVYDTDVNICHAKYVMEMKYKHYGNNMCMDAKYVIIIKVYAFMHILAQHATLIAKESLGHWSPGTIYVVTGGPGQ